MKSLSCLAATLMIAAAPPAMAEEAAQLYASACARCHGPDGQGARAPAIAGKDSADILTALSHLTDRAHVGISDSDRAALANWLAQQ